MVVHCRCQVLNSTKFSEMHMQAQEDLAMEICQFMVQSSRTRVLQCSMTNLDYSQVSAKGIPIQVNLLLRWLHAHTSTTRMSSSDKLLKTAVWSTISTTLVNYH